MAMGAQGWLTPHFSKGAVYLTFQMEISGLQNCAGQRKHQDEELYLAYDPQFAITALLTDEGN